MGQTDRQIRWGILSTARVATRVCRAIHRAEGSEVVAVASRDAERARRWASERGIGRSYGSYEQLLGDEELDAIYIALPPSMHAEWTILAAEAGKHVLCEKPFTANAEEAERVAAVARASDRVLVEAFHWRYHPLAERMIALADEHGFEI